MTQDPLGTNQYVGLQNEVEDEPALWSTLSPLETLPGHLVLVGVLLLLLGLLSLLAAAAGLGNMGEPGSDTRWSFGIGIGPVGLVFDQSMNVLLVGLLGIASMATASVYLSQRRPRPIIACLLAWAVVSVFAAPGDGTALTDVATFVVCAGSVAYQAIWSRIPPIGDGAQAILDAR